ncbi:hypothetical protein SAMN05421578_11256 [Paenibacillus macquariensis]|uniref:Uncharacterized protein n=1 Tax=Paenibacillus macquariensis TaxID=948756 RepID=A0ABY1K7L5_9BACL|nr:hypothetical protein SAMN05421578_11256 [Paenibacillus macquariensis]
MRSDELIIKNGGHRVCWIAIIFAGICTNFFEDKRKFILFITFSKHVVLNIPIFH